MAGQFRIISESSKTYDQGAVVKYNREIMMEDTNAVANLPTEDTDITSIAYLETDLTKIWMFGINGWHQVIGGNS